MNDARDEFLPPRRNLPWDEPVRRARLEVLQLNLGRYCNLACRHCHVEAGPGRSEKISVAVRERVERWIEHHRPAVVDLTGGAPELIPGFRELVVTARRIGARVLDRCNLAVLAEPGQEDLGEFLAGNQVEVVASLPCYLPENVDRQRGAQAHDLSMKGLRRLNALGYGFSDQLPLHLVYNPQGPTLPPAVGELEAAYRDHLRAEWGIEFNDLWTITNMPIARFERHLRASGELERYEDLLLESFNPEALDDVMCRTTLSVDHEGRVFDCDFNLALDIPLAARNDRPYLWDIDPTALRGSPVAMKAHCLGCTAGRGSSCQGSVL